MRLRLLLAAVALVASPTLAFAQCSRHSEQVTSSCIDGYTWDAGEQACVPGTSS